MNHSQLRAFHAVALEGSFTRAGRALRVSQPTLSAQVKALEDGYAIRLFDRKGPSISLTGFARDLLQITSRIFAAEDEARAMLTGSRDLHRGRLAVGADSPRHTMALLAKIRAAYPALSLGLTMGNMESILRQLRDYRVDVALLTNPPASDALTIVPFRRSRLVLQMPVDHRLARFDSVSLDQIGKDDLVLREATSATRQLFDAVLAANGVKPPNALVVETREGVREAVLAGLGTGIVIEAEHDPHPALITRPITAGGLNVSYAVVCLPDRRRLANVRAFLDLARAEANT